MQTRTIISMFFAAFILDIFRSMYSSSYKENKTQTSKRNNSYQKQSQKYQKPNFNFDNENNPSMKIKDEKGDDIKISFDKPNKKKNIIYLTIQFCQS